MSTVLTANKICPRCERELPATTEYFHKNRAMKDGLYPQCKRCWGEYQQNHKKEAVENWQKYNNTINGHLRSIFSSMKFRCTNVKAHNYKHYGGRGIKVCFVSADEFVTYVINELRVDPRGLTIDRIDNDRHYEPGNIRFITNTKNQKNKACKEE